MDDRLKKASESHVWVKDIQEDDTLRGLYLAKVKRLGLTKRGDPFLSITLADRTGDVEARMWEKADTFSALFREGDVIKVSGVATSYRDVIQITLSDLRGAESEVDPSIFIEATERDVNEMMGSLRGILRGIKNAPLKRLVDQFLGDRRFMSLFKKSPAAKNFHHGYLGGLLEHTLSLCQMTQWIGDHYPELDKDLLVAGAFLHDVGKVKEYKFHMHIDYSDEGRLLGHLILGVAMVDEKLAEIKDFPRELALKLKHLILSHHGQYEFGSPKRPKFLEAFALHLMDDLDAKINGLGRFMERDRKEGSWTEFNRLFERYLMKGGLSEEEEVRKQDSNKGDGQGVLFT